MTNQFAQRTVTSPIPAATTKQQVKSAPKNYTPTRDDTKTVSKANDAFEGLADQLKKYWIGSEKDRDSICKAFQRPYVRGIDNTKPKNTILLIGPESRGRLYAVQCISELLKQKKTFRYSEVANIDLGEYSADSSN